MHILNSFRQASDHRLLRRGVTLLGLCVLTAVSTAPLAASSNTGVLATIGRDRVTEADVIAQDKAAFDKQQADNERALHQLQSHQAEARHDLLDSELQKLLDKRAVTLEAKKRGVGTEAVLKELTVPAVTDEEIQAFYDTNKSLMNNKPLEQMKSQITQYLATRHNDEATRHFYDDLRARHGITSLLGPYRVTVAATGPALGNERAPVTIVEFADFQCPYCRQAEEALKTVMARHPDDVRLVFRHLPLTTVHANAMQAAEAAVCADHQGKFWEMHDAMFGNQSALTEGALKDTAKRLGLEMDGFSACLADPGTQSVIDRDTKAADELSITGTPFFLINGRPLNGSVPADRFETLVSEELEGTGKNKGSESAAKAGA